VPQGRDIFPRLTVAENLQMGLATQKRGAGIPQFIFEMFPILNMSAVAAAIFRRPAAAARNRPRVDAPPEAAHPDER
jgi:ABC-type branched-subunit amino acid transport system ATPase component